MKNKFQRMSKQEKKELVKSYRQESEKNNAYMRTLNRMLVIGVVGLIYGFVTILADIFLLNASVLGYLIDAVVMIFTTFIIVQRNRIYVATMNFYAIEKENKKAEKKTTKKKATTKKETKKDSTDTKKKRQHVSKNAAAKKQTKKA